MMFKRMAVRIALGLLSAMLAWVVFHRIQVPLFADSIYLHYGASLIGEHGFVPYRDLFEINFPLTYLVHVLIGKAFGFGEFAFRLFGFLSLFGLFALISGLLAPIHRAVGWFVALAFGLLYLSNANYFFQRDFLVLIPAIFIIQSTLKLTESRDMMKHPWLGLGAWAALAALIKPHYVVILPVALLNVFMFFKLPWSQKMLARGIARMALGFSIPVVLIIAGLWHLDGWDAFVELVLEYMPLYAEFKNEIQPILFFRSVNVWAVVFVFAMNVLSFWEKDEKTKSWLRTFSIFFLLGCFIGAVQGYGRYYYLFSHLMFFAVLGISMTMRPRLQRSRLPAAALGLLPVGLGVWAFCQLYFLAVFLPNAKHVHRSGTNDNLLRKDFIVSYFEQHTTGQETIQPYHWSWPITAALLDLERPIATKYICALQFHHGEEYPYIRGCKDDFVDIISLDMPDYFVVYLDNVKWQMLPDVQEILNECYVMDAEEMGVGIYKRKPCTDEE